MECGREEGGKNVEHFGICPAFPDHGTCCAEVDGTFCDLVRGFIEKEFSGCRDCNYYLSEHYDKN
ncbi:MAG: hypothetical protein JRF02_01075 [Deltaproteobacteria bacterium]|nr:hypothetical protein [Deltaproteobacteria bacterium]